jgi:hypothetical protein
MTAGINPTAPPSGDGCVECLAGDGPGWWLHLRRCAECGHVGCCDSSPSGHATKHWHETGHPIMQSFEPGEDWFWSYPERAYADGPELAGPTSRPAGQAVPGPEGKVPADWRNQLR